MKIHQKFIVLAVTLCVGSGCRSASTAYLGSTPNIAKSPSFVSANPHGEPNRVLSEHDNGPNRVSSESAESAADDAGKIQQVSDQTTESQASTTADAANVRLSVRAAIETGLAQNPDLIALRQTEGVGVAAVGVAQTYPFNPWVQVQATPYQQAQSGGPGTTYHYVLMMQQIQLGHQQEYREQAACTALNGIRWNVVQAELLNVAQTERLYFTAVYQKGLRDLANIYAENNRQLLEILERQKEIGQATGADVAIVRLDARSTRQQQRVAEANYQTALLDLKRQLFLPADADIDLDADVMNWGWRQADRELNWRQWPRPARMSWRPVRTPIPLAPTQTSPTKRESLICRLDRTINGPTRESRILAFEPKWIFPSSTTECRCSGSARPSCSSDPPWRSNWRIEHSSRPRLPRTGTNERVEFEWTRATR